MMNEKKNDTSEFEDTLMVMAAKLHIKGRYLFVDSETGSLILKSPNGSCWMLRVDNDGILTVVRVDCPDN